MAPESLSMEALSSTVRRLRRTIEDDLCAQVERQFRLSVSAREACLDERGRNLRARLEGWTHAVAISEMASRTLFRLVLLRQLEARGMSKPVVLTGGWSSKGYREFCSLAPALTEGDHEGFDLLVRALFAELACGLPGLYGAHPLDACFFLSPFALREVLGALDSPSLERAWQDDTTLGWIYQFWNDPSREAIDKRVGPRGRVKVDEIASKTQLFTESYMVDWLLQNSVGRIALKMRERRGISSNALEVDWPMYVKKAASADDIGLPLGLNALKILDPACGSGHFLSGAFDLLVPLYRQEAADAGRTISDAAIVHAILVNNLHGIDIDERAVQVAASVLYLKAQKLSPGVQVPPMNLVATRDFRGCLMPFGADDGRTDGNAPKGDLGIAFVEGEAPAGIRLREILSRQRYDVVAFNPPYLATSKIEASPEELAEAFGGASDIFAAVIDRSFELCKPTGFVAFVALSNWMFLTTFRPVRERMLKGSVVLLVDLGKGAFQRASKLIQTAMVIASPKRDPSAIALAARIGSRDEISKSQSEELAGSLRSDAAYTPFEPALFSRIEGSPLLFWLDSTFMHRYGALPKIGDVARCLGGIATSDNDRFLRAVWEVSPHEVEEALGGAAEAEYTPYVKGAEGREWLEPFRWLLRTRRCALELRLLVPGIRLSRPDELGVAYTTIGQRFAARIHSVPSIRDVSGASAFAGPSTSAAGLVCALNRRDVRELASALNPTINFQVGDVRRLPFDSVDCAETIVSALRDEFAVAERGNELSPSYVRPIPDRYDQTQAWAQKAVDRPPGAALEPLESRADSPSAFRILSHAVGVTLGRFGPGGGIAKVAPETSLSQSILYLGADPASALNAATCAPIRAAWALAGAELGKSEGLNVYLKNRFFNEHKRAYQGRPIYFPLSSARRGFVAFVSIHHFTRETLSVLLADFLLPDKRGLESELADIREARQRGLLRATVEKRFADAQRLLQEATDFAADVTRLAECGPPSPSGRCPEREVNARYEFHLGDGVFVNAAGLWPLLEPQWKDPKAWWIEIARADGKKNWDWSRLAARYFPARVRRRCAEDASLAAAHGCLREFHPSKALAWEQRLRAEVWADFRIDEPNSDGDRRSPSG